MKTGQNFLIVAAAAAMLQPQKSRAAERPNLLVILADDLGFSDLGCYGSEIETPNLDRLAAEGLRFSQFYTTAKCHASRISLLTGRYPYQAGNRSLLKSVTVPEVLGGAGYFTAMTGKWHLQQEPTDFGFQRYFGHLSGSCNYFIGNDTFRLNGQPWKVPSQGFYTTIAKVDFSLDFIAEARAEKKPWFLYIAFNAPHDPLQPLEEDYKKYLGRYDVGWDTLREARNKKQSELGLFSGGIQPCPRPDHIPAWDSLTPEVKSWESRRMAAYAALVDRMDREIGRLVENLRAAGELDNTLILFFSDNGANPYDRRNTGKDKNPFAPDVFWRVGTGWAWLSNTPFRLYKQNQFEGGIITPAIAHWPAGLKTKAGSVTDQPAHLIDILPTLAEAAGAEIPDSWPGRELTPMAGISLGPVFSGGMLSARQLYFLYNTDRGIRDGDWKLVSFQSNPWELYNLREDRTELRNLASQMPEMTERLAARWFEMAEQVDTAPASRRRPILEVEDPSGHPLLWTDYGTGGSKKQRRAAGMASEDDDD